MEHVREEKKQAAELRDARIRQLAAQGVAPMVIARRLGVHRQTVWRALKENGVVKPTSEEIAGRRLILLRG